MDWLKLLVLILQLAAYVARRAERRDIERNVLNELELLHGKRVDRAVIARDDILSGRVSIDPDTDPNRRD